MYCRFPFFAMEQVSDKFILSLKYFFLFVLSVFPLDFPVNEHILSLLFLLFFLIITTLSMMVILLISAHFSLSHSSFACLHFSLYSVPYLGTIFCLFVIHSLFSFLWDDVSAVNILYISPSHQSHSYCNLGVALALVSFYSIDYISLEGYVLQFKIAFPDLLILLIIM